MKRTLLACFFISAVLLTGCSSGEEEKFVVPFPTVTETVGLPPPPEENIVPEQENGVPLPLPTDTPSSEEERAAGLPLISDTPTPIIVTPPPPEQLPTAEGNAQAVVSVVVSNLVTFAQRSPESTVELGEGIIAYSTADGETLNVGIPPDIILAVGVSEMVQPIDPMFIQGNYCVSLPRPDASQEYYVLTGSVLVQPTALPVVRKKPC